MNVLTDNDFTDENPKMELVSITVNDPDVDVEETIKDARIGAKDLSFKIRTENDSDSDLVYTITYRATNKRGGTRFP